MINAESLEVAKKLMVLLESAASLGLTATLNLETRNGRISTTFTCEESRDPDEKPSSNSGKNSYKSNGSLKRSKERMVKYQEGKKKKMEMDKDWRKIKDVEKEESKPAVSVLVCEKCSYKCTRNHTLAKHMNTNHNINESNKCKHCKKDHASKNDLKVHMELHRTEEKEKQNSESNANKSFEEQYMTFEESKRQDLQNYNDIDKLIWECQQDLLVDDWAEVYSDSDNNSNE